MIIRVKDHTPPVMLPPAQVQEYQLHIAQATLEGARGTKAGQLFLEVLSAVDFAGQQRRPVMLVGRKQRQGGFRLYVHVPIGTRGLPRNGNGLHH